MQQVYFLSLLCTVAIIYLFELLYQRMYKALHQSSL